MNRLRLLLLLFFCWPAFAVGQAPVSWTSAEMYLAIRKLNVLGSVLYVAAHPDDENTRLIAYFSKDRMYRTGYLSLTRGDGGQNLVGNEQGIELGLIRTQELIAARRVDGGEQFFTRAYDFGFSKNPAETFDKWDRNKILSDVVWVVRRFRPDVIITRFPTTGEGGHGHHTASALLAVEAFTAAADPTKFPEQLKYVEVWQPKRVLWNTFSFGNSNFTSNDQFKFDVGGYNPLLGKSYGEISAISRSNHKSQGFGAASSRGETLEYFRTLAGTDPVNDIMEQVETGWQRVPGSSHIARIVDSIAGSFDLLKPDRSVKGLVRLYQALELLPDSYWKQVKMKETKELIQQCSGLFLDATTADQFAVKTDSVRVLFAFNNRLGTKSILKNVSLITAFRHDTAFGKALERNRNFNYFKTYYVSPSIPETQPYWLEEKMEEGYFNVKDQLMIGRPDMDPSFVMLATINVEGKDFEFSRPVMYKFTDPVKGELYEPLVVQPPVVVTPDAIVKMTIDNNKVEGVLKVQAKKKNVWVSFDDLHPLEKGSYETDFDPRRFLIAERNGVEEVKYKIKASNDNEYKFGITTDSAKSKQHTSSNIRLPALALDYHEIKYDHIPYMNYFTQAAVTNRRLDLKIYNKKIGYIVGAGDKVPEALEQMGYDVVLLSDKELSRNNLNQFDAIITGVRAYNTNEWMNRHYNKLMNYVQEGGNLIVQYNTSTNLGPVRAKIGPYNFNIARTRVSDETAPVQLLKPEHPVFNFPNKITQEDFRGWVQERSIYHAGTRDSTKFETVLAMGDPGEKADEGSLIIARHGKGYFTYTGIVFFRQLPAGVPGAYRLLANLIALNRKKGF